MEDMHMPALVASDGRAIPPALLSSARIGAHIGQALLVIFCMSTTDQPVLAPAQQVLRLVELQIGRCMATF